MEEENKQTETGQVLEAVRETTEPDKIEKPDVPKKSQPEKPKQWAGSEAVAQLQALVEQSRGLKNEPEAQIEEEKEEELLPEPEEIDPISVEQIKVMRHFEGKTQVHKSSLSWRISNALIRAYCDAIDFFKPSGRAQRCLMEGHQCLHCGEKFIAPPSTPSTSNGESNGTQNAKTVKQ